MYRGDPGSHLSRVAELCVQFLVCALAIYWAVKLLEAVWLAAVLILLGVGVLVAIIAWVRAYRRGW